MARLQCLAGLAAARRTNDGYRTFGDVDQAQRGSAEDPLVERVAALAPYDDEVGMKAVSLSRDGFGDLAGAARGYQMEPRTGPSLIELARGAFQNPLCMIRLATRAAGTLVSQRSRRRIGWRGLHGKHDELAFRVPGRQPNRKVQGGLAASRSVSRDENAHGGASTRCRNALSSRSHAARTVSTGHGASETTRAATLPRKNRAGPVRPCVPMMIRSTLCFFTASEIASWAGPVSNRAFDATPRSRVDRTNRSSCWAAAS